MHGVDDRVAWRDDEAAKARNCVLLARWRRRLLLSLQQLVHRVNDRGVKVALVAPEHAERLIAIAEERAKTPRQLDADEGAQQRTRAQGGARLPGVDPALLANDAEPLMKRIHAEQARHARDRDVQKMLEVVV